MKSRKVGYALIVLSVVIAFGGMLALWLGYSLILARFGGFNIASFGVTFFLITLVLLVSAYVLRYAQNRPFHAWHMEIMMTFALLAAGIGLAFAYDWLLPSSVPVPWRYFILPSATVILVFYLLRRIPKVRKIIDDMSKN